MGHKVIWTDEAIADLRQIVAYIARDNPAAAMKLGEELIRKSMLLAAHPRLGKVVREMKREMLRELIIQPYRLIYEIDDRNCAINVRVLWHGARKEPELR